MKIELDAGELSAILSALRYRYPDNYPLILKIERAVLEALKQEQAK